LRQLSCSRRAELGMHGSQAVRSLLIGFSRARAARVVERAHLVSPIAEFDCDGLARGLTARDRGFALGSSQPACSSPAATQRPQHRRSPTRNTSSTTVDPRPDPAASHCYGAASTAAGQRHLPSAIIQVGCHPEPAASGRAVSYRAQACNVRPAAGGYPSTAKGPARVTACQPSGCLSTPHRQATAWTAVQHLQACMPKPRISHECGKQSPTSARPVVATCRTCGEVHEEIYTYRSTPSRIANTMSHSVSLNGWMYDG